MQVMSHIASTMTVRPSTGSVTPPWDREHPAFTWPHLPGGLHPMSISADSERSRSGAQVIGSGICGAQAVSSSILHWIYMHRNYATLWIDLLKCATAREFSIIVNLLGMKSAKLFSGRVSTCYKEHAASAALQVQF